MPSVSSNSLKSIFPRIFLFDYDTYLSGSTAECAAQLTAARKFKPQVGLGLPNAGYGILLDRRPKDEELVEPRPKGWRRFFSSEGHALPRGNVFADDLGIPVVLPWDHLITQAPQYFLGSALVPQAKSQSGCLEKLKSALAHKNFVHHVPDSGHVETFERLGILRRGSVQRYVVPAHNTFLGKPSMPTAELITDRVLFAGNLSSGQVMSEFGDDPLVKEVQDFVIGAKCQDWSVAAWRAFEDIAARKVRAGITELDPDHSFFWSLGREVTLHPVLTAFRTTVFKALKTPIDFYGGFTDPSFVENLSRSGLFRAMGSVPFEDLKSVYARYEFSIDITHTPFISGSNSKVLNCFAAGGFMFVDWKQDLRNELGELAEEFMYQNADDLRSKMDALKRNPKRRLEIIQDVRERLIHDLNFTSFLSRTIVQTVRMSRR